jgi:CDP-glucose 4,6-dehydratase
VRIVLTGHTGFKGSWFSVMLKELGHELYGYSLKPIPRGMFDSAKIGRLYAKETYSDIRNAKKIRKFLVKSRADLVIHFAAQPLVRYSYKHPEETFNVNVNGTLNVLKAGEESDSVSKILIITTDKVYKNSEERKPFVESDPLGGSDPYSTSKAMADLLTQSWSQSISNKTILIGRAGNVIGGGDFAEDRLIPDLYRSYEAKSKATLRNPESVRPWQHVLDCLNGYLKLIEESGKKELSQAWNFGPEANDYRTVRDLTIEFQKKIGAGEWLEALDKKMHEAGYLTLDSSKAFKELNWRNKLNFEDSVSWTADWFKKFSMGQNSFNVTIEQVRKFMDS